jgi:hypothetical protein
MISLDKLKVQMNGIYFRYIHDEIVNNFNPINKDLNVVYNYENKIHHQIPYSNQPIIKLDKNIIYFVLANTYSPDLGHNMGELNVLLQIFETFLKNQNIDNYTFRIVTKYSYYLHEAGKFKYFVDAAGLINYIDFLDDTSFYKGKFLFVHVVNYMPNFNLNYEIRRDFYTIYQKCVHIANIKYAGYPTIERIWIYRGLNISSYWHKRFFKDIEMKNVQDCLISNKFHKIVLPDDCIDFTHQIYLLSNCKVVFSEVGKFFINIFFMKKGSKVISVHTPSIPIYPYQHSNICKTNDINLYMYENTELDVQNEYYVEGSYNNPYKTCNVDDFTEWINTVISDNEITLEANAEPLSEPHE